MEHDYEWRAKALCVKKNLDFWYPPLDAESVDAYYSVGKKVCNHCPVWEECLNDGLSENWGLWGGLTPTERTVFTHFPKKTALKHHGTIERYKQGCRCTECTTIWGIIQTTEIDITKIPDYTVKDFDILFVMHNIL